MLATIPWHVFSEVYGFIGNSLLKPMTQTSAVGLDPTFWDSFPDFDNADITQCINTCTRYACEQASLPHDQAVQNAAVEYTHLFVGPPFPAAAPWETLYRHEGVSVGFGEATFEMRQLLREAGLGVSNENHQYEDHLGIELLYLSDQCRRKVDGENDLDGEGVKAFIGDHPCRWIGSFHSQVAETCPGGYYDGLLALTQSILVLHSSMLS